MVPLIVVTCVSLYVIGLRADRIHAGRTVTEPEALYPVERGVALLRHTSNTSGSVTVPLFRGHSAGYWNWRYRQTSREFRQEQSRTRGLRRTLLSRPSVTEAINLAAVVYGNGSLLWSLARCESKLNPNAKNASGSSGLMQFMPGTFASTPFGGFSIWSPYANAMAGGWMLAHGRRSEWVC